jgi:two-component system OmpR family sensor kinase
MSIKLRLAVVFTAAAAILFALGSWLFVTALSASLLSSIDAQLSARLSTASRYLPGNAGVQLVPGTPAPGEYIVQIVDPAGRVRGGSAAAGTTPALSRAQLARARHQPVTVTAADEDERERVMAAPLPGHRGWVAVAAVDLEAFDATIGDVTRNLLIAGAVFAAAAGLGSYALARAALSPVERLRREVAALSERDQARTIQVPRTRDEIAALATTMNQLLDRLRLAQARQRALVADASHELRTPFAVLSGELELASRPGRSREELEGAVAHASEEATRLARVTEQLLFLARADEDMLSPRRQPTDIKKLLTSSAEQAASRALQAGITCDVQAPAGLVADVDPDRIREAVHNLVDNALRFAPAGTPVILAARAAGSDLIVQVKDEGPGFPTEFLPHAFERFRRPDSARAPSDGGAGLGLAIVSAIAHAHRGRARASNSPGGGAVVTLEFPGAVDPISRRESSGKQ